MKIMAKGIPFSLNISYKTYYQVYAGNAKFVAATALDGRRIRFPAEVLKPYLTHDGIKGVFVIFFDDNHKFKALKKISA